MITGIQAFAQTYPVQAIPQVMQPPAVYLSDYAGTNNTLDRIKLQLLLTDLTVLNREVKLKLYIEGNGIKAQSNDFVIGAQPLFLEGGIPLQLGSIDLAPYFELQNLSGISAGAYANALADGLYQFCFEVYDVLSGNVISRKSCTNVLVFLNDPPFLNLPENQANLEANNPQNILFQWTPRHINVSNVEYEFTLVELHDLAMPPEAVFAASPPLFQTVTTATSLLYGIAEPQLLEGTRYVWRVQAKAKDGVDEIGMFKNNGYSEIFSFTYQGFCQAPEYLQVDEVTSQNATFKWQGGFDHSQYKIAYRKALDDDGNSGVQNSFTWFESTIYNEEFTVIDLEPDTLYEWRVGGFCADGSLSFSDSKSFTTMETEAEAYYNCGIAPDINIANTTPKDQLQQGEVIKAGDFNVKITEVSGSDSFSGKGYTTVGFLKNLKIALVFSNIKVNTDNQFISGEIQTVYDPTWSNMLDIDEVIDEAEDVVDVFTGEDDTTITLDFDIDKDDITVDTDAGKIIITDENGDTHTYDYDKEGTYTITDASGDEYIIDKEGEVLYTGHGAPSGPATAQNTNGVTNGHKKNVEDPSVNTITDQKITFTFSKGPGTKYELDQADNDYEKANYHKVTVTGGTDYYPVHKAVAEKDTAVFYVDFDNKNPNINTDSLIFKKVSGTAIKAVKDGPNRYKITVKGNNAYRTEEAIITYQTNDTVQQVLSSFFIHHIKKHETINVNVVYVNGAKPLNDLETKLNTIYNPAGASFNVGTSEKFEVAEDIWDILDDNGVIDYDDDLTNKQSRKELEAISNYYRQQNPNYDRKAYYIFVLGNEMKTKKDIGGFMLKTKQFGYLFEANFKEDKRTPEAIAAHELSHGVFALAHPFEKDKSKEGTAGNWLMDNGKGTALAYPNWAKMSSDGLEFYFFPDNEDSQSTAVAQIPDKFLNKDEKSFTFMTLNGSFITLPKDVKDIWFTTGLDKLDEFIGYPIGAITRFTLDGKIYRAKTDFNSVSVLNSSLTKNDLSYKYSGFEDEKGNPYKRKGYDNPDNKDLICLIPYYTSKSSDYGHFQGNYSGYLLRKITRADLSFNEGNRFNLLDNYDIIKPFYKAGNAKDDKSKYYNYKNKIFHKQYELQQDLMDEILGQGSWSDKHALLAKYAILNNAQPKLFKEVTQKIFNESYDKAFSSNNLEALKENYIPFIRALRSGTEDLLTQFNSVVADGTGSLLDAYWMKLYEIVEKLPSEIIEEISFENRTAAINLLLRQEARKYLLEGALVKKDKYEDQILRLIKFIKKNDVDVLLEYLDEGRVTGKKDHLWYYTFHKLDNSILGFNKDNRTNFIRILTEHYYKSKQFAAAVNKHEEILLASFNESDLKYLKRRQIVSDYKNIYERAWASMTRTSPLLLGFFDPNDAYTKYTTDYQKENGSLNVEKNYAHGFEKLVKDTFQLRPFDLIYYRTTSSIGALSDYATGELMPLPAIVLYYDDDQQGLATTKDVAQLAFDVGTLVIPGGQFTKLKDVGKLIYLMDKMSSLSSIAGSALQTYDAKTAGILNDISLALGVVDIANLSKNSVKTSIRSVADSKIGYQRALELINENADDLSKISKKSKEQLAIVLSAEREMLKKAGAKTDELGDLASTLNRLVNGMDEIIRGISKKDFTFKTNGLIPIDKMDEAFELWKNQKWQALEEFIKIHGLGDIKWPPCDGFVNIEKKTLKKDDILDRYDWNGLNTRDGNRHGSFASPKKTDGSDFTFEQRALNGNIEGYSEFYEIKILEDIEVEIGDVIPWFGKSGGGKQIKFSEDIFELYRQGKIDIINVKNLD